MVLGEFINDYMSCVWGIYQCMEGIMMDKIILIFAVTSLYHNRYPGVKFCHLAGNVILVNCNLLDLSGLLPSKDTQQQDLELTS